MALAEPSFQVGDRVTMRSGVQPVDGTLPPMTVFQPLIELRGTVEPWGDNGRTIVRWDDWPLMTALPNPNVRLLEGENGCSST